MEILAIARALLLQGLWVGLPLAYDIWKLYVIHECSQGQYDEANG